MHIVWIGLEEMVSFLTCYDIILSEKNLTSSKNFKICYFTFLLLQKSNKKGAPKTITPRFRDSSLIKLLYYCKLNICSLIVKSQYHAYFQLLFCIIILIAQRVSFSACCRSIRLLPSSRPYPGEPSVHPRCWRCCNSRSRAPVRQKNC